MIIPSHQRSLLALFAIPAAGVGALTALHYHRVGLTLSHYDARGHLVVARRIIDNITPGWQQIGAVWLPLPHLLNALPAQIDAFYRTGAFAVAVSVLAFALATAAVAWIVVALTRSAAAAIVAAAVFAFNPNVLYLQATPMTEPLLLALTTVAVALLIEDVGADLGQPAMVRPDGGPTVGGRASSAPARAARTIGITFALACLTRYEAWPVTVGALVGAVWARWRHGDTVADASARLLPVALYPAAAILAFIALSRIVVGEWFVSGGFFVPENKALGEPLLAAAEIWWGIRALSGGLLVAIAGIGLVVLLVRALASRRDAAGLIALALLATATVPWAAFIKGHPFRVRYVVPLLAVEAIGAGVAVGSLRRFQGAIALAVLSVVAYELNPLDPNAAMVVEAQWDRPNTPARRQVTDCLRAQYDGDTIMASMGSLAHYMQDASRDGFRVRDFLHEGNGDLWLAALGGPRPFAGWILIEEKANGGDVLARIARENPRFLDGFSRVCDGAGLALYRRTGPTRRSAPAP